MKLSSRVGQTNSALQKQGSKPRKGIISLFSTLMRLHLEHCFHFWSSQGMSNTDILSGVHRKQESEALKEKMRDLGLFILVGFETSRGLFSPRLFSDSVSMYNCRTWETAGLRFASAARVLQMGFGQGGTVYSDQHLIKPTFQASLPPHSSVYLYRHIHVHKQEEIGSQNHLLSIS